MGDALATSSSVFVVWSSSWSSSPLPTLPSTPFIPEERKGFLIKSAEAIQGLSSYSTVHWTSALNPALPWYAREPVCGGCWPGARVRCSARGRWLFLAAHPAHRCAPACSLGPDHVGQPPSPAASSQGCSWPLVTQETDGECRSWWLERAVSRELLSSPPGPSSPSRMFTERAGEMLAGPCSSLPSPGLGCCIPAAKRVVASLISSK